MSIVNYKVEIWGWKERERIEKLQDKYLKWMMGVKRYTPGYMIREELQRETIRVGMRAWSYEKN